MRLGILITSMGNFGKNGFYNSQEVGLAKVLDKLFDEVTVYKAISEDEEECKSLIEGCKNAVLHLVPVKSNGVNGIWDCSVMDKTIDALLYFSDLQISVPKVFKWCCQNNITMYPYIGVTKSSSTSKLKRLIINTMFKRNIKVYKKCQCFVKTPTVKEKLYNLGIKNSVVTPVGLDFDLLHKDYEATSITDLKSEFGYKETDKIILFIGRMTEEKQPQLMVQIFKELYKKNTDYRLLMVGKGELLDETKKAAGDIRDVVHFISQIENKEIWKLYRIAEAFVNLNDHEIFGMAILEAMYYGCKVVALKAPGPNFIIEDKVSGYLVDSASEAVASIELSDDISYKAYERVANNFTWNVMAKEIKKVLNI